MEQPSKELTEFDSVICDSRIQMMKSAIPFVGPREQRFLSIYVKYIELSKTISLVKNLRPDSLGVCSITGKKPSGDNNDFIQTIRKYCNASERETIDMITNMMSAYKMLRMYKETMASAATENPESESDGTNSSIHSDNSLFNILKSQLSPEQQEMFDMYSTIINT